MEAEAREAREGFTTWNNRLSKLVKSKGYEASAWNMYNGNHWDSGRGYIGPVPLDDDPSKDRVYALIHTAFTSRNVTAEVTDRCADGLTSRSPGWMIYDQDKLLSKALEEARKRLALQQQADVFNQGISDLLKLTPGEPIPELNRPQSPSVEVKSDNGNITFNTQNDEAVSDDTETVNRKEIEAEIILSNLWTKLKLKQVITDTLTERLVTGRGGARVYIPKKYFSSIVDPADEQDITIPDEKKKRIKVVKVDGMLNAVDAVRVENVKRSNIKVIDVEGYRVSVVKLERKNPRTGVTTKGIEVSFVNDDDNKTYIAVYENGKSLSKKGNQQSLATLNEDNIDAESLIQDILDADVSSGIFLDKNLIAEEIVGKPFVTEQLLQCNRALNLDLTLAVNVLIEDGFTEMITTNASIATVEMPDPNNPSKMIKKEVSLKRGASYANNIVGLSSYDEKGMRKFEQPEVMFREPTSIDSFERGGNFYYMQCLAEGKQLFVLSTKDSEVSGESRIQARQDYVALCRRYKPEVDKFGSWLLTTLLNMVASIAGKEEYFKGIGVNFDSKIYAGDLSSDEKDVVISRYEKGLISREDALVLLGTEDPLIEIDKIRADQAEKQYNEIRRLIITSRYSNQIQEDKKVNSEDGKTNPEDKKDKDK